MEGVKKIFSLIFIIFILASCRIGEEGDNQQTNGNQLSGKQVEIQIPKEDGIIVNVDELKAICNGSNMIDDDFYKFYECSGEEEKFYVVRGMKYSKEDYNNHYDYYLLKGPLCTENLETSQGELQVNCKQGEYAIFLKGDQEISYEEYRSGLLSQIEQDWDNEQKKRNEEYQKKVVLKKAGLKNYITFLKEVKKGTYSEVSNQKIGDECFSGGGILYNGVGVRIECNKKKIEGINYFVNSEEVPKSKYMKYFYDTLQQHYEMK